MEAFSQWHYLVEGKLGAGEVMTSIMLCLPMEEKKTSKVIELNNKL